MRASVSFVGLFRSALAVLVYFGFMSGDESVRMVLCARVVIDLCRPGHHHQPLSPQKLKGKSRGVFGVFALLGKIRF